MLLFYTKYLYYLAEVSGERARFVLYARSQLMSTQVAEKAEQWEGMMRSFPSDGWDGAATVIARHDQKVCELERELDHLDPDWHAKLDTQYHRRTRKR